MIFLFVYFEKPIRSSALIINTVRTSKYSKSPVPAAVCCSLKYCSYVLFFIRDKWTITEEWTRNKGRRLNVVNQIQSVGLLWPQVIISAACCFLYMGSSKSLHFSSRQKHCIHYKWGPYSVIVRTIQIEMLRECHWYSNLYNSFQRDEDRCWMKQSRY